MAAAVMAVLLAASVAWACVGLVSLTTASASVQPGDTLTLLGKEFAQGAPVLIHLDTINGPVLATAPPPTTTMTSQFTVPVPIPADVGVGQHVLIATQDYHNMNAGAPARAVIYVGVPAPTSAAGSPRPVSVITDAGLSGATLAAIVVAAAAAGLALFGAFMLASSRRRPEPEAVKAS